MRTLLLIWGMMYGVAVNAGEQTYTHFVRIAALYVRTSNALVVRKDTDVSLHSCLYSHK
jgi:hypothetical protein